MTSEITKRALYGPVKVGGDILSNCTKCKMELAHVVVAMVDGRAARVMCKTCKSTHNHRKGGSSEPRTVASRTAAGKAARVPVSVMRVAELWQKKVNESKASVPKTYQVSAVFIAGDAVEHPKFGLGIVEEIKGGKMVVLFRDAERVLVHSLGSSNAAAS